MKSASIFTQNESPDEMYQDDSWELPVGRTHFTYRESKPPIEVEIFNLGEGKIHISWSEPKRQIDEISWNLQNSGNGPFTIGSGIDCSFAIRQTRNMSEIESSIEFSEGKTVYHHRGNNTIGAKLVCALLNKPYTAQPRREAMKVIDAFKPQHLEQQLKDYPQENFAVLVQAKRNALEFLAELNSLADKMGDRPNLTAIEPLKQTAQQFTQNRVGDNQVTKVLIQKIQDVFIQSLNEQLGPSDPSAKHTPPPPSK